MIGACAVAVALAKTGGIALLLDEMVWMATPQTNCAAAIELIG
jgi:hypothetical protein